MVELKFATRLSRFSFKGERGKCVRNEAGEREREREVLEVKR